MFNKTSRTLISKILIIFLIVVLVYLNPHLIHKSIYVNTEQENRDSIYVHKLILAIIQSSPA